jgi:hypothetical protein
LRVDKIIVITGPAGSGDDATSMTSVVAISPADAWAAGSAGDDRGNGPGFVEHWTGGSWRPARLPSAVARYWNDAGGGNADDLIAASSAANIWVFAGDGKFIRRSGGHWTSGRVPGATSIGSRLAYITTVDVLSRSDVWIFGTVSRGSGLHFVPYAAHFNGHTWAAQPFPGTGEIAGVGVVSARDMWAVTGPTSDSIDTGRPSVAHWNGSSWRAVAVPPPALPSGSGWTAIVASSDHAVWLAGGGAAPLSDSGGPPERLARWNGGPAWSATTLPPAASRSGFQILSLVPDGTGGVLALDTYDSALDSATADRPGYIPISQACSLIFHYSGGKWSQPSWLQTSGSPCLADLAKVPHRATVWAVGGGSDGIIALTGPTP